MAVQHYRVRMIPNDHKQAINRLIAWMAGENIWTTPSLSQPASADGQEPETWWFGGAYDTLEGIAVWQGLAANLPTPEGGWPLRADSNGNPVASGGSIALEYADAMAAAQAMTVTVESGEPANYSPSMPLVCLAAALAAKGVQRVEY